jgi:3D-(3,5/4)-trihydroxycyclohexane-1,2-dione acylhydrolase (decyclizing)
MRPARRTGVAAPGDAAIDTDPFPRTPQGGSCREVAGPEVSTRSEVARKHAAHPAKLKERRDP